MSKVLKITKPDKTIHVSPMFNKARITAHNNRLPADKKMKIEVIDEEEAKKLPFIDKDYVTGSEAQVKVGQLQSTVAEKDAEIERLKALLAGQGAGTGTAAPKQSAVEVIALIEAANSVDQVNALANGDERATVKKAAEKRIAELEN